MNKKKTSAFTADENGGLVYTHTLKRPFTREGRTFEKLIFSFGKLTGRDSLNAEQVLKARGHGTLFLEQSSEYLILMAARACKDEKGDNVNEDILNALPYEEYMRIRNIVRNFSAGLLSTAETEDDGSESNA